MTWGPLCSVDTSWQALQGIIEQQTAHFLQMSLDGINAADDLTEREKAAAREYLKWFVPEQTRRAITEGWEALQLERQAANSGGGIQ